MVGLGRLVQVVRVRRQGAGSWRAVKSAGRIIIILQRLPAQSERRRPPLAARAATLLLPSTCDA